MNNEKIHLNFLWGIICIIVGLVSLIYSFSIPTTSFPYNAPASVTFTIIGVIFIILGIILFVFKRGVSRSQNQSNENNDT